LYLRNEVIEVELVLCNLFLQLACLSLVVLLLSLLHQADDVAHAQNPVSHPFRIEDVNCIHLLACADELDRLVHH